MSDANPNIPIAIVDPRFYVITGAPGAGKTALLRELESRGYRCVPEVARQIIQEQVRDGGDALPWANTARYAELMLTRSIGSYLAHAPSDGITFADRGIPDTLTYARVIELPETIAMRRACENYRYNRRVFMAPAWQEIYHTDAERKQSWADAVRVHEILVRVYEELGYECLELPRASVKERADFVVANLV